MFRVTDVGLLLVRRKLQAVEKWRGGYEFELLGNFVNSRLLWKDKIRVVHLRLHNQRLRKRNDLAFASRPATRRSLRGHPVFRRRAGLLYNSVALRRILGDF